MNPAPVATRWSLVARSQGDSPAARAALSELCEIYYAPVLAYVRTWEDPDQARDLTHAFFESILGGGTLGRADPGRGRFRSYLLGAVKHFLLEQRRRQGRQKRGGGRETLALEDEARGDEGILPPDAAFDRAWACVLLDRSLTQLAEEMSRAGKGAHFEALRPWLTGSANHGEQRATAERLGLNETAMKVQVHRLRRRFREIVEAEVSQTLEPGADVSRELRQLLAAW